jgi:hypothetical protein
MLCQPGRAVSLPQVATLHRYAIEPIRQPGELAAGELDHRHERDAGCLQTLRVLREAAACRHHGIAQLLQLLPHGRHSSAQASFDLSLGDGVTFRIG